VRKGNQMQMSAEGLAELKAYEGCRRNAYQCEAGVWTIGYGDTSNVKEGMQISAAECDERLIRRVAEFEAAVMRSIKRPMTQGQFDAFVSLAFNIGTGGFTGSTLVKRFNGGEDAQAAREFGKWVLVKKVVSPNLVRRRVSEIVRYFQR